MNNILILLEYQKNKSIDKTIHKTIHKTDIKEINNFYGYQCINCLHNVWKYKNTIDEKLVKSFFCSNDCKYSYQLRNKKKIQKIYIINILFHCHISINLYQS
jgi:hypothetical protein